MTSSSDDGRSFNDVLTTTNEGYGVGWNTKWNSRLSQSTNAYFSKYRLTYNFITFEDDTEVSDFEKRNVIYDSGISSELNYDLNEKSELSAGYQYALKDVGYAFVNREDLEFILDSNEDIVETHSAYLNYTYKNPKLFDIRAGIRGNYFKDLNSFKFEPRILLQRRIFENVKLQLSGEIKHQIISEIDETILSDLTFLLSC